MERPTILRAEIRDIAPYSGGPRWELSFDHRIYGDDFQPIHHGEVELEWPSGTYRHTVGFLPGRPIYLHTGAQSVDGKDNSTVIELCDANGIGRRCSVGVEVLEPKRRFRVLV